VIRDVALLVASAMLASEILLRLPLMDQARKVIDTARRSAATVRSRRISDHWKETVLPAYSLRMGGRSIYFFVLLCMVALPVALAGVVARGGLAHWFELLMQPFALAILCICSILYILVRTRLARG
jgi:hypothetical protein